MVMFDYKNHNICPARIRAASSDGASHVIPSEAKELLQHHRTPLYGVRLIHRIPRTPSAHKFAPGNPGRGPLSGSQS